MGNWEAEPGRKGNPEHKLHLWKPREGKNRAAHLEKGFNLVKHDLFRTRWRERGLGQVDRRQDEQSLILLWQRSVRSRRLPRKNNANARKDEALRVCRKVSFLILGATFHSQNMKWLIFCCCHKANHFPLTGTNRPVGQGHQNCYNPHLWMFSRVRWWCLHLD